jgi:hypothetical protein
LAIAAPPAGPTLPPAAANARLNSTIAGDHLGDVAASRAAAAVSGDRLGDIAASRAASAQTRLSEVAANQQASQAISRAANLTSRAAEAASRRDGLSNGGLGQIQRIEHAGELANPLRGRSAEAQNQGLRRDGQETAAAARLRGGQPTAVPIGPPINPHDEALRRQLASIDRMRDEAVARGDARLLERADMLEQAARDRFARFENSSLNAAQTAGEGRDPRFATTTLELTEPLGPGFGRQTAMEARADGRAFGQRNAEIARQRQGNEPFANLPTFDEPVGPGYGRLTANDARQGLHRLPPTDGGTTETSPTDPTGFDPIDPVLPDPIDPIEPIAPDPPESPEPDAIEPLDFEPLTP